MKDIKFRAINKIGIMIYWDDLKHIIIDHFFSEKDFKFMQFTGLKDKKGKDIYEGDILKIHQMDINEIHVVKWVELEAKFVFASNTVKGHDFWFSHYDNEYEVIGNIYENPELIK